METPHVDVTKCTQITDTCIVHHFLNTEKPEDAGIYEIEEANEHIVDLMDSGHREEAVAAAEANKDLIKEAFTVASETGLSPRQLAEQRAELLETMQGLKDGIYAVHPAIGVVDEHGFPRLMQAILRARATAQEGAPQ